VRVCVREAPVTTHVSMFACTCVREAPVTTHVRVRVCVRASVREAPVTTHVCVRVWLCLFTYVCVRRLSRPACVCACVCVRKAAVTKHVRVRVCVCACVLEAPVTTHVCVRVCVCVHVCLCMCAWPDKLKISVRRQYFTCNNTTVIRHH
jgi:hypothetical protein